MQHQIHDEVSSSKESNEMLKAIKGKYGFIPNLMGVLAESAPVLSSYLQLGDNLANSSFSPQEIQVMYLAINYENNCHYCMAAHSTISKALLSEDVLESLRSGTSINDPKLNALATFTRKVVDKRGWLDKSDVKSFTDAGYSSANILDVVLGVAHKTISNYVNHIGNTPVDNAFKAQEWSKN